jgi:hypothetical protein
MQKKKSALLLFFLLGKEIKKASSGWLPRVIFFERNEKTNRFSNSLK